MAKQREVVAEYNSVVNRIKLNEQISQKLEETAQEVFNEYFNQSNNGKLIRLGDIIQIRGGFSYHSRNLAKGSSYLLGMGCISFKSRFLDGGMRLYSDEHPERHRVNPLDIVIATRQQSKNMPILGYPAMIPPDLNKEKLIVASNLYRVINKSEWSNYVLYQLFRSPEYLEHIKLNTKGTTVGMITKDALEDFCIKFPSVESGNQLQSELKSIINLIFIKRKEIKSLIIIKDTLLSKMTKVDPKK